MDNLLVSLAAEVKQNFALPFLEKVERATYWSRCPLELEQVILTNRLLIFNLDMLKMYRARDQSKDELLCNSRKSITQVWPDLIV